MSYVLKKGDRPEKKGKKTPLITDGRVKAFIGKARTWRLKDESFTYYYNMFRSTFIFLLSFQDISSRDTHGLFVFRFLSNFRFSQNG